jgi:DNA mismatch endonuclease, patch repair protein
MLCWLYYFPGKYRMADRFSAAERSRIMSLIKGKDTEPERIVRRIVHRLGFRFRLHVKELPGKPDIVLPRHHKVIFTNGCFWHGHHCKRGSRPSSNTEFWDSKIESNIKRDRRIRKELRDLGWKCVTIWQCQMKNHKTLTEKITRFMTDKRLK